ncbi:uncharacterized protein MELLADRAFT_114229 [Melampsora larici-populina 98AG31]|uniref:Uncharacterized protein n=1 Tax=Melampsora larici-populina (strain 98AG31 / pathotype 3-4-7) TaxID=747676 RepID=F4SCQ1_MELLP|nr:uncharacterized protein MELLADRAFT_114229 [Melampsora larici-populina 98AG31]EGF97572.1 hypothetical protein MELLADRAFT_114229 [Melampsora larici-populina 98AG31]
MNVWSHTLEDGSLSDVGTVNEELMEQAWSDSKANSDSVHHARGQGSTKNQVRAPFANNTSYHKNGRQQNQTYHDNPRTSFTFDNHKGGSNGARGRGQRGRGGGRGNTMRGGGPSVRGGGGMVPSATTLVNGIMVPKFGPGAFEALKTAQANSSSAQL